MYKFEAIDKKKTIKKCLKDIILYKPNKAHPQENMNQIFDKTKYQKKEKIMDFYYSFFLTRECVNYLPDIADSECNDAA